MSYSVILLCHTYSVILLCHAYGVILFIISSKAYIVRRTMYGVYIVRRISYMMYYVRRTMYVVHSTSYMHAIYCINCMKGIVY